MGRTLFFCVVQMPLAVLATAVLTAAASLAGLVRPGAVQALSRVWSRLLLRLFRVDVRTEGAEQLPGRAGRLRREPLELARHPRRAGAPAGRRPHHLQEVALATCRCSAGRSPSAATSRSTARTRSARAAACSGPPSGSGAERASLVFPEGTRSPRRLACGTSSAAASASRSRPACRWCRSRSSGVKALVPRGLTSLRPGRITLRVHPAIPCPARSKDDAEALAEETRAWSRRRGGG